MEDLMEELDAIVASGTKVNIDYYLDENLDEYAREDIMDYFMQADSDSVDAAYAELKEDDITVEEIRLMRIKFLSDMANNVSHIGKHLFFSITSSISHKHNTNFT